MLTITQMDQYARDGWCVTEPIFTRSECDAICAEHEQMQMGVELGDPALGKITYRPMLFDQSDVLTQYLADERLITKMMQLLGPDLRMYWEQLVVKPAQARTEVPWHQDDGYAPTDPPGYVTVWIALDDVDADNGGLWVIPGSHTSGRVAAHYSTDAYFRTAADSEIADRDGVPTTVPRGAALIFHSLLLHRSGPNTSNRSRRGWIVQYCPASCLHGTTKKPLDDRVWVARDGECIAAPYAERRINLIEVFANWAPTA